MFTGGGRRRSWMVGQLSSTLFGREKMALLPRKWRVWLACGAC
ncbi:MAG: hypothetical protein OJF48_001296 [Afipia sp.]|nr:MAG: hypothetical protein OJF48_001296 [Afipia sp.]